VWAKTSHQVVEAIDRVATEMALEMQEYANVQLRISPSMAKAILMLKREALIGHA
jgi:hypothetical protein